MSSIEGIDQIGEAAARIEIQGPENEASRERSEIEAAIADARKDLPPREPDALERQLADEMGDGLTSVEINGPEGTTGAAAIEKVIGSSPMIAEAARVQAEDGTVLKERIFDDSAYVAVPEVDGQATDQIVIAFTGSVSYDASDEQGAKLYRDLKLGKAVELRVAGFVSQKAGGYKVTAREEEVVTGKATMKVDTMYLLTPDQLV